MLSAALAERPSWNSLYETSVSQAGLFTTSQAAEAGYSPQLLVHHLHAGNIIRLQRGIYRLVHFPTSEDEQRVAVWLWTELAGVISHDSALALHQLSDVLPAQIHVTIPEAWRRRRLRVPAGVVLHHADVPPEERTWFGPVPITQPRRTLNDCAKAALSPDLLQQAAHQALRRGLVTRAEIGDVETALAPFGGLAT
jgi:predicted transcriptional regulator of viral defense system